MRTLTAATAVGAALVGGVFFAFSTFVMRGLRQARPEVGMASMQSINRAAPTAPFMLALLGTAVACVALGAWSLADLDTDGAILRIIGAALYLLTIAVTAAYHVPRNNALAEATSTDAWTAYAGPWVAWNHVRTLASLGAAALLTASLT